VFFLLIQSLQIDPQAIFFANGEISDCSKVTSYLESFEETPPLIAVDGGFNYCYQMDITPTVIVGDMDSANPLWMSSPPYNGVEKILLDRAKDCTDLGFALETYHRPETASVLFGAFGYRPDHSLYNLYLLLKYPKELFLFTEDAVLFALSETHPDMLIHPHHLHLTLFPFYGKSRVLLNDQPIEFEQFNQHLEISSNEELTIRVTQGEALVLLANNSSSPAYHFLASLLHTPSENRVFLEANQHYELQTQVGQTLSLFPLFSHAVLETHGLKWDLGGAFDTLDKNFLSLSNVSEGEKVEIQMKEGRILCFLTDKIDEEMLSLEDLTSTRVLTKASDR
jgi:thiamine pyrophosphokinase